ncbi:MAG: hypothetical protein ACJ760_05685 [Thermoleophilaceae bacterium]
MSRPAGSRATPESSATEVSVELPARPSAPALARRALAPLEQRLSPRTFARLRMIVTELVTASLRGAERDARIELSVEVSDDRVVGQVSSRAGPGRSSTTINGPALFVVTRLADRWSAAGARGAVTFELDA